MPPAPSILVPSGSLAVGRIFDGNQTKLEPLYERLFAGGFPDEHDVAARFGLRVREADLGSLYGLYFHDLLTVIVNPVRCANERQRRFTFVHEIGHHLVAKGHVPWARPHEAQERFCDGLACLALGLTGADLELTLSEL